MNGKVHLLSCMVPRCICSFISAVRGKQKGAHGQAASTPSSTKVDGSPAFRAGDPSHIRRMYERRLLPGSLGSCLFGIALGGKLRREALVLLGTALSGDDAEYLTDGKEDDEADDHRDLVTNLLGR